MATDPTLPASCHGSTGTQCDTDGPMDDQCRSSDDCPGSAVCVAPYGDARGYYVCQALCVPLQDDTQWCADDAACCDSSARCSARGYCLQSDRGSTSTATSDGSTGASTSTGDPTDTTTGSTDTSSDDATSGTTHG